MPNGKNKSYTANKHKNLDISFNKYFKKVEKPI